MQLLDGARCREVVPMLDEAEAKELAALHNEAVRSMRLPMMYLMRTPSVTFFDLFAQLKAAHLRLTGHELKKHHDFLHHRLADLGGPCAECGVRLLERDATSCGACGAAVKAARRSAE